METTTILAGTSEETLIMLGKAGDRAAIGELFRRNYRTSLKVARRILTTEADSEDAVQSAYCAALQHLGSFRGDASFGTWVNRIVVNRCLATFREPWRKLVLTNARSHDPMPTADYAAQAPSPETSALHAELATIHSRAVSSLGRTVRDAYVLHVISDMPLADVAEMLGLTLAATKSRIFRAKAAVQRLLNGVRFDKSSAASVFIGRESA